MLKGVYNQINQNHAAQVIKTRPVMPGAESAIGEAEVLRRVAGSMRGAGPAAQAATVEPVRTKDQTFKMTRGPQVTPDQFPMAYYIGEDGGVL